MMYDRMGTLKMRWDRANGEETGRGRKEMHIRRGGSVLKSRGRKRISVNVGHWHTNTALIFTTAYAGHWTSLFFRQNYLYPALEQQQANGDAYLRPFLGPAPSNRLPAKFWSLHCYRQGARSHVSRGGIYGALHFRKATPDQVYEHARWRRKRSSESIDKQYQAWTLHDRIAITLTCQ